MEGTPVAVPGPAPRDGEAEHGDAASSGLAHFMVRLRCSHLVCVHLCVDGRLPSHLVASALSFGSPPVSAQWPFGLAGVWEHVRGGR